jgi:uncharacterized protein
MTETNSVPDPEREIYLVVKRYADAWLANDLRAIIDSYHDDVVFHYFGRSPLAGTHKGKAACLAILKQVREKTNRKLIGIRDVLTGKKFGLIVAVESFEHKGVTVEIEIMLRYTVRDNKLAECWIYDEDQRLIDEHFA